MSWKHIKKLIYKFEVHEIMSLFMLGMIISLYGFGMKNESYKDTLRYFSSTIGPISKTIIGLIIVIIIIILLIPNNRFSEQAKLLCRNMGSFLIMLLSFGAIIHFITIQGFPLRDIFLQKVDKFIFFGKQPAEWLEPINSKGLTLFFSGAYLSWFIFTYGTIFLSWFYGKKALLEYTTTAMLTFYIGYFFYIIVPGVGPLFTYSYSTSLGGLTSMMTDNKLFNPAPDVFPSLHTGIAVVMLVVVWRYCKIWTWLYFPVASSIIISTLYLRIHYGIDVYAGIGLSIFTCWCTPTILEYWEKERQKVSTSTVHVKEGIRSKRRADMI